MEKKNENKLLVVITVASWIFFIALFVGRAIGIILTHDDVTSFGEFFSRLGRWSDIGFFGFLIAITIAIVLNTKKTSKE